MVDITKIGQYVALLRDYRLRTENLKSHTVDEFLNDWDAIDLARQRLQICIQICIDIAQHVVASAHMPVTDAYDTMQKLNALGAIPDDLLPTLKRMVGMRNALVHVYMDVDNREIYNAIHNNLGDFDRFIQYILEYIDRQQQLLE